MQSINVHGINDEELLNNARAREHAREQESKIASDKELLREHESF